MSLVVKADAAATGPVVLEVTPDSAGWTHSGLVVVLLAAGESHSLGTGDSEAMVLSLGGGAVITIDGSSFDLQGRTDVFAGPSDVVYVPRDAQLTIASADGGRFAVCTAVCSNRLEAAYLPATDVPVELRGAGQASRKVNNFGVPGVLEADRLICCEVITPGGNWSSWPPHKHDEEREGETQLEEIYYFEVQTGPAGPGMGFQRVYGHDRADIDISTEVRTGDVVLIPHGWHGPSMAAPGYDLYYLNVMAGPGAERSWLICDDPAHTWIRATWDGQPIDPRLTPGADA